MTTGRAHGARGIDEPVTLTRIYTRHGDGGETRLADGSRALKSDARVEAYGTVDELNAALGLVMVEATLPYAVRVCLLRVQNELFDLGADLAVPVADEGRRRLRVEPTQVSWLEQRCDTFNAETPPLHSFVLPGGSEAGARLHVARTVCRRAERRAVALAQRAEVNPATVAYLNRLGDLLFILARYINAAQGADETLWRPGASTSARPPKRSCPRSEAIGREAAAVPDAVRCGDELSHHAARLRGAREAGPCAQVAMRARTRGNSTLFSSWTC